MATTSYSYKNFESLGDIANKFNTSVLHLVKLNNWLRDPNDGHTFMMPAKSPKYIRPNYVDNKIVSYDFLENVEGSNCKPYRRLTMIVPLVGNGSTSIEDYWDTVNDITGISYKLLIDNLIDDSTNLSMDFDLNNDDFTLGNATELNTENNSFISVHEPILPEKRNKYQTSVINTGTDLLSEATNDYIAGYVNDISIANTLSSYNSNMPDYSGELIGNYVQELINLAGNRKLLSNSHGSFSFGMTGNIQNEDTSNNYRTDKTTSSVDDYSTDRDFRVKYLGNDKYVYGKSRFDVIGNPNIIKGQVVITIDGISLYMPCYPEGVKDSTKISYSASNSLGRSEPYQAYENSGPRSIPFTFKMHREMIGNITEIEKIVRYIESAAYPKYGADVATIRTTVKVGNSIYISGIMVDQSTDWEGPIGEDDKYNVVTVSFTIIETTGNPKTASDIRSMGGYRTS